MAKGGRFRERDDIVRLKWYLSSHIRYDIKRVNERRPLLRHSAEHILKTGFGFCGENARVAIRLFGTGGVQARRLYLEGKQWQHAVVEHEWEGGWKLFDAHADASSLLPDEEVCRIESSDIRRFPNHEEVNPWLRSYRVKVFHGIRMLQRFEQIRPPGWIAQLAETPALVKAGIGMLGVTVGLFMFWLR